MDSRDPCVINWGAGFIYWLPCHSKWWNTERCVGNAGVFDPVILSFVVVFPDLHKGYIFVIYKARLKMELEIRSFCKWLNCFSTKSKNGSKFFPPNFQYFWCSSVRWIWDFFAKQRKQLPWLELTAQTWQTKVPLRGLASHEPVAWCGYATSSTIGHFTKTLGQDQKVSGICYFFNG